MHPQGYVEEVHLLLSILISQATPCTLHMIETVLYSTGFVRDCLLNSVLHRHDVWMEFLIPSCDVLTMGMYVITHTLKVLAHGPLHTLTYTH